MQEQHQFFTRGGNQLCWSWTKKATEPTQKGLTGLQVSLRETPQKILLLQGLVATSGVCQPGSQLER